VPHGQEAGKRGREREGRGREREGRERELGRYVKGTKIK